MHMAVVVKAVVNKLRRKAYIEVEEPTDGNLKELKRAFRFLSRKPKYDWQGEYWTIHINDLPVLTEQGLLVLEEATVE
jgi:hypothetical protein